MRMPMPEEKVDAIKRMLSEGFTQRDVALNFQLSPSTVNAIAHNTRWNKRARKVGLPQVCTVERPDIKRTPVRCRCGALVYPPCLACQLRKNGHHQSHLSRSNSS